MKYLTYIQKGSMHPKLMPIDEIIAYKLKEVTQQLPQELYFPFKFHAEDWLAIEITEHTEITAFCDKTNIYTILRFPLIAQPTYDLIISVSNIELNEARIITRRLLKLSCIFIKSVINQLKIK